MIYELTFEDEYDGQFIASAITQFTLPGRGVKRRIIKIVWCECGIWPEVKSYPSILGGQYWHVTYKGKHIARCWHVS